MRGKLEEFIENGLNQGYSKNYLREYLIEFGWEEKLVDSKIEKITKPRIPKEIKLIIYFQYFLFVLGVLLSISCLNNSTSLFLELNVLKNFEFFNSYKFIISSFFFFSGILSFFCARGIKKKIDKWRKITIIFSIINSIQIIAVFALLMIFYSKEFYLSINSFFNLIFLIFLLVIHIFHIIHLSPKEKNKFWFKTK